MEPSPVTSRAAKLIVVVAALGYFVDIYDLLLFGIVRVPSLLDLGGFASREAPGAAEFLLREGTFLLNAQMLGLLVGGVLWGVLGDRRGRKSVLFGSIVLYSLANLANAFVTSVPQYAILRFIAGVGLAGELGAGITLVSETMHRSKRGLGTMTVAGFGVLGAVVAALVGDLLPWRWAYAVGGVLGLMLLLLRVGVIESGMFAAAKASDVRLGAFGALFSSGDRLRRYLACIAVGLPIWVAIGLFVTFAPELAQETGVTGPVSAGTAILFCYLGLSLGDFSSGAISQRLRSRKRVILGFALTLFALMVVYAFARGLSPAALYALCLAMGFFAGYWALFVTNASEQFGTNLRATATTTVPNFVRGAVVPMTLGMNALREPLGLPFAALTVGAVCTALVLVALAVLPERFDADLDYTEELS